MTKKCLLIVVLLAVEMSAALLPGPTIHRSTTVRRHFEKLHPCPANGATRGPCPGYIADHIVALRCGGADVVENLQWQTVAEARRKDRIEWTCRYGFGPGAREARK